MPEIVLSDNQPWPFTCGMLIIPQYEKATGAIYPCDQAGMLPMRKEVEALIDGLRVYLTLCMSDEEIDQYNEDIFYRHCGRPSQPKQPRKPRPGFVYLISNLKNSLFKIGQSIDPKNRFKQIQWKRKEPMELLHTIAVPDMTAAEKFLHMKFLDADRGNEWFALTDFDAKWICSLTSLEEYINA